MMGSSAGTYKDLGNNLPQKTLCRTVQLDTRTVWLCARTVGPYGRTVRYCMQTVRHCTRTVRLGSLGFVQYVAARVHF
jgi:hypothetical protein